MNRWPEPAQNRYLPALNFLAVEQLDSATRYVKGTTIPVQAWTGPVGTA